MYDPKACELIAEVGANLRYVRHRRCLTQKMVADRAGISSAHLSTIESGKAAPGLIVLIRLTRVLDIPITTLWDDPDPVPPPRIF